MTWRDEMKTPENVDELVSLIVGLVGYYGGSFCIEYESFIKEFPFINDQKSITSLIKKLQCNTIFTRNHRKVSTTSKFESLKPSIVSFQQINI